MDRIEARGADPTSEIMCSGIELFAPNDLALLLINVRSASGRAALERMEFPQTIGARQGVAPATLALAPGRFLCVGLPEAIDGMRKRCEEALTETTHLCLDATGMLAPIDLRGWRVRALLSHLLPLDIADDGVLEGRCCQTLAARAPVIVYRPECEHYRIIVERSLVPYLWGCIEDLVNRVAREPELALG